jgi:hypothetical protein
VIYKGPFKEVVDDDDHVMERGQRYAVCDKTFNLFKKEPYRDSFEFIEPYNEIPLSEAQPFDSNREPLRHPKESKGQDYTPTTQASSCCDSGGCC